MLFVCNFSTELVEARRLGWVFYDTDRLSVMNQNRANLSSSKCVQFPMQAVHLQTAPVEER